MPKKATETEAEIDETICGPGVLRFEAVPGFAQRRQQTEAEKKAKQDAANDHTGCASDANGDDALVAGVGHCVSCRA